MPQPWASATLSTGAGVPTGPAHLAHTSLQPARALPSFHTQAWLSTFCSPELGTDLHMDLHLECHTCVAAASDQACCCSWDQDQKPTSLSEGEGKGLGLMGKAFTNGANKAALYGA